jgi:hypothetical protein
MKINRTKYDIREVGQSRLSFLNNLMRSQGLFEHNHLLAQLQDLDLLASREETVEGLSAELRWRKKGGEELWKAKLRRTSKRVRPLK